MRQSPFRHLLTVVGVATIVLEINPVTSESIRLGVLALTEEATHSVVLSALAFGGITLIWELACVIVAAHLLEANLARKIIGHIRQTIGKVGLKKLIHSRSNLMTDLAITLLMGSPATIILKHSQDPERSIEQNRRLGYVMSVGASIVATLQGAAIAAGIWHPSAITITIALATVLISLIAYHYIKKYLANIS